MLWTRERVMTGSRIRQHKARLKRIEDRLGSPAVEANSIARARFEALWIAKNLTPAEQEEFEELGERLEPNWYEIKRRLDYHPLYPRCAGEDWRKKPFDPERKKRRLRLEQLAEDGTPLDDPEFERLALEFCPTLYERDREKLERKRERVKKFGYAYVTYENEHPLCESNASYFDANDRELRMKMAVHDVEKGSDADFLEIKTGDIILTIDGKTPTSLRQFTAFIRDSSASKLHTLVVRREPELLSFDIGCGKLGAFLKMVPEDMPPEKYPRSKHWDEVGSNFSFGKTRWCPVDLGTMENPQL
jgi:hypothetical protein